VRWAAVLAAAVFALPHLDLTRLVPIFALGLILTYLYVRTRSLIPGILVHSAVNSLSLLLLILLRGAGYTSI
jgi:membrane protease YdiL (CAAX protease family)